MVSLVLAGVLSAPGPGAAGQAAARVAAPGEQRAGQPPVLPDFVGSLVNFDDSGPHVAVCALEPGGGEQQIGARAVPNTYVWVLEGQQLRQLGTTPGSCDPAWSPSGDRLAVVQPNGLWTYSPSLGEPQQLADAHLPAQPKHATDYTAYARPRWSADGRFIAALVTNGGTTWVEVFDSRTGRRAFTSERNVDAFAWGDGPTLRVGDRQVAIK
jgi:hypothetical protein